MEKPNAEGDGKMACTRARGRATRRLVALGVLVLAASWHVPTIAAASLTIEDVRGSSYPAPEPLGPEAITSDLTLTGCLFTGVNHTDEQQRMRQEGWVPEGWKMLDETSEHVGGEGAVLFVWTMKCEGAAGVVATDDPVGLSFAGVALDWTDVTNPVAWHDVIAYPIYAVALWGIYTVEIHTDNSAVADWLTDRGFPVDVVTEVHVTETPTQPAVPDVAIPIPIPISTDTCGPIGEIPGVAHSLPEVVQAPEPTLSTTASVPSSQGTHHTHSTSWVHHNAVTHCHDQVLWHGPPDDPAGIRVQIPVARDHFCTSDTPPRCGISSGASASDRAAFLGNGGTRKDSTFAFDHERIPAVHLTAVAEPTGAAPARSESHGTRLPVATRSGSLPETGGGAVAGAVFSGAVLLLLRGRDRQAKVRP